MFNCDHCQKKYKRSWHQARHNQMKHENSNASTATTSSTGTPPTPEINGNLNNNNNTNFNYQQIQMPQQPPISQDHSNISSPIPAPQPLQQQQQQNIIPSGTTTATHIQQNVWDPHHHQQQQVTPQPMNYGNEMIDSNKNYGMQQPPINNVGMNNGEFMHYAVNEQYSNKFDVQAPSPVNAQQQQQQQPQQHVSYDSWVSCRNFPAIFLHNRIFLLII
jgi:hypothetical protein